MTGFAALNGASPGWTWAWDMRAVNARGLDIRLRLPDWIEGLEGQVRAAVTATVKRGNVTVGLKLARTADNAGEHIDEAALVRVLGQMATIDAAAAEAGLPLARASAADVLAVRGVLVQPLPEDEAAPLAKALGADLPQLVAAFDAMRISEGTALAQVLTDQLARVADLAGQAAALAEDRKAQTAARLKDNLAKVLSNTDGADPDRVAQELALIAVKSDVTEEIDRLRAHVAAARDLLSSAGPVGRKLDFLMQEFNREANTLCSKSQSTELTRVGLDLKATIDQMREQVQNVE